MRGCTAQCIAGLSVDAKAEASRDGEAPLLSSLL